MGPIRTATLLTAAIITAAALALTTPAQAAFFEDFGTLADGTAITTSNTDLTYVRIGTGGGPIEAQSPSTLGTTGSSMLLGGSSGGSLTGVGVGSGLGLQREALFSMTFKISDITTQELFIGVGSGTTFTGNSTFTGAHLLWGLRILNGGLSYRDNSSASGAWVSTGFNFSSDTVYGLTVYANGSNLQINVDGTDLTLITNSRNGEDADGFRIYGINGTVTYEIDNIAIAIPEPASLALMGLGGLVLMVRRHGI